MKSRNLSKILCLVLVGLWMGPIALATEPDNASNATALKVLYLYGQPRCPSCKKIESFTQKAVSQNFADEVASGEIVFQALNTDLAENKHYIKDYGLYTKSVVLSLTKNGEEIKFKNLEKVWPLLTNEKEFLEYVQNEIEQMRMGVA